jgi:hypothetical protein
MSSPGLTGGPSRPTLSANRITRDCPMSDLVPIHAFKQTYFQGYRSDWAEPALGFSKGQSPASALNNVLDGNAEGKLILLTVPQGAKPRKGEGPNPYRGRCYAVVECASEEMQTAQVMRNYPDSDPAQLKEWVAAWPRCLPILHWYDIANDRLPLFAELAPNASHEAMVARGKLRRAYWLTEAAALTWNDLNKRPVWPT